MRYKRRIIFLYLIVAYILMTLAINFGIDNFKHWYGLVTGLALMLIAIPFHSSGKTAKIGYIISFLLNSIGVGLSISTFYTKFQLTTNITSMIIAALIGFIVVLIFGLITFPQSVKKYVKVIVALIILVLYITSIVLWIQNDDIIYSLIFFYLHISYFYMVGIIINSQNINDLTREMSIISFGAFIFISIIVLIIISEGEALGGLDGLGGTFSNSNRKNALK